MFTLFSNISPVNKLKLKQLFFICVYWIVMLRFFIIQNFLGGWFTMNAEVTPKFIQMIRESLIMASSAGLVMGLVTGILELYVIPRKFQHLSFIKINALKFIVAIFSILLIGFVTISIYKFVTTHLIGLELAWSVWDVFISRGFLYILFLGIFLSIGVNFILSVQNKMGHKSFIPLLLGKYHQPRVEERIFLFIDLKSSSYTAEKLGHIKYSQLLQQCFRLLADLVPAYYGEIYQFVGDECVISWKSKDPENYQRSINLFWEFRKKLNQESYRDYRKFGVMPQFKGAVHAGEVMAAEVGGFLKTEMAFHGDVLNTTARILEYCRVPDTELLISESIYQQTKPLNTGFKYRDKGSFKLRGKNNGIQVYSVATTE